MPFDQSKCEGCPLDGMFRPMEPIGPETARFMVVTEVPSAAGHKERRLLPPAAMRIFGTEMTEAGFTKDDFLFYPACRCPIPENDYTNREKSTIIKHCRAHMHDVIAEAQPEVIVPLGKDPTSQVFGRSVKITHVRGLMNEIADVPAPVFPIITPSQVVAYPQNGPLFAADVQSFARFVEFNYDAASASVEHGDYQIVTDLQFLIDRDEELLSFDTETTGVRWYKQGVDVRTYNPELHKGNPNFDPRYQILTMQFSTRPGEGFMLVWDHPENPIPEADKPRLRNQLRKLLCKSDRLVGGHNDKFDNVGLWMTEGIRYRICWDTLLAVAMLDENAPEKNLDVMTKIHVPEMAGYADCVHPDTLLLMEDLTKKRAADIKPNDRLIGFSENAENNESRRMEPTEVVSVRTLKMHSYRITMDNGQSIQVSSNHQFLRGACNPKNGGSWVWKEAGSLKVGEKLKMFPFPDNGASFDDGWISGILDGEGYITDHGPTGMRLGFCQLDGPVLRRGIELLNGGDNAISWGKRKPLANVTVTGARAMKELIRLRPLRLIAKKPWEGKRLFVGPEMESRIRAIEYVGIDDVVSIQTTSRTFVANGFSTHNCFNQETDKSRMWEVPLDKMRAYGCGDTDAALRLWLKLEPELMSDERQWSNYCNVGIPGLNALAGMETRGMFIDIENELPQFQSYMETEVGNAYTSLLRQIPRTIKRQHVEALKGDVEKALSFGRKDFLRDVLFYHPDGFKLKPKVFTKSTRNLNDRNLWIPSTSSKDHLPYFFEECPFTFELAEYVKDERLLSTNVISFREKYVVGGKVRPVYNLHIAVTGRTASQDPNGQNYPKRSAKSKMYRKMFTAPEGYYVCELDLSQAELRIAASMARDPTMLQIYREAGDIHTATALVVLGMTMEQFRELPKAEQKLARTKAKSVNFGFLYGMGWRNFIVFAKTQYNVEFTEAEAKAIRAGFFKKYSRLPAWHERMRNFAKEHKFVRSFSGRIRHLPMVDSAEEYIQQEAMRQAINSPVQEFGSSLGVMALGRMEEVIDPEYLQIVGFIHDAIVVYIKKEYLDWGLKTVKGFMESNPIGEWFGSEMLCPIVADAGFGTNLGEIHELEGFSLEQPFDYGSLRDKEGNLLIDVPPQQTPPNDGRLTRSPFTLDTDLEPETAQSVTRRVMCTARTTTEAAERTVKRNVRTVSRTPHPAPRAESPAAPVKRYTRTPIR